jgi:hypothetical protein
MSREETLNTRWGEFIDLVNCRAIENGNCKQKPPRKEMDLFDFLALK